MKTLAVAAALAFSLAAANPARAQAPDDTFLAAAYAACVAALTPHIAQTGAAPVQFAARERVQMVSDGGFRFAFSAGTITGATTPEPNPLTFMKDPAGSCSGQVGVRKLTQVILNGAVLSGIAPLF